MRMQMYLAPATHIYVAQCIAEYDYRGGKSTIRMYCFEPFRIASLFFAWEKWNFSRVISPRDSRHLRCAGRHFEGRLISFNRLQRKELSPVCLAYTRRKYCGKIYNAIFKIADSVCRSMTEITIRTFLILIKNLM